jgi:hypothetical protein
VSCSWQGLLAFPSGYGARAGPGQARCQHVNRRRHWQHIARVDRGRLTTDHELAFPFGGFIGNVLVDAIGLLQTNESTARLQGHEQESLFIGSLIETVTSEACAYACSNPLTSRTGSATSGSGCSRPPWLTLIVTGMEVIDAFQRQFDTLASLRPLPVPGQASPRQISALRASPLGDYSAIASSMAINSTRQDGAFAGVRIARGVTQSGRRPDERCL